MAHRDSELVRPFAEDPRVVGPYFAYVAQEADLARDDARPAAVFAHERSGIAGRLDRIAERYGLTVEQRIGLQEAFYVGRFSQLEDEE